MIFVIPSLLLPVRAAPLAPVATGSKLLLPLSSFVAASASALLVDDCHVVGKVTEVVVLLAHRNLAVDLYQGIKSNVIDMRSNDQMKEGLFAK